MRNGEKPPPFNGRNTHVRHGGRLRRWRDYGTAHTAVSRVWFYSIFSSPVGFYTKFINDRCIIFSTNLAPVPASWPVSPVHTRTVLTSIYIYIYKYTRVCYNIIIVVVNGTIMARRRPSKLTTL